VITIMGDGDAVSIGGNHLIHAARRNVEIASFIINNQVYGMTGGQCSPTTPYGAKTTSSPYGNPEPAFDISRLVEAAGAVFVGRTTVYHTTLLDRLIDKALSKSGFSMVEVIAQCVTYSGRWSGLASPAEMMAWQRDNSVTVERAQGLSETELAGKIVIGVLADREKPACHEEHRTISKQQLKV
jgi:2-oxoglutarate/2-oxoacid ferredoxin oxidoreductase subunit beta